MRENRPRERDRKREQWRGDGCVVKEGWRVRDDNMVWWWAGGWPESTQRDEMRAR